MASKQKKRDPFSYFGGLGDCEDDDESSEDEEGEGNVSEETLSFISKATENKDDGDEKLPSAELVLKSSANPTFLKTAKRGVDWDKYAKDDTRETETEPVTHCPNNVPPPESYEPVTDPLKPSIGDPSEKENGCEIESRKRQSDDAVISEDSPKKSKTS